MKKKILLIASVQCHIAQFHIPTIKLLQSMGYEVHVAARNNLAEKNGLTLTEPDKIFDFPFTRSPISKGNFHAYSQLKKLIAEENYAIIHCHTPAASVITRLAAREARKTGTKVIYTAHGFHFFSGAPLLNWLVYYPIEKIMSYFTDALITINQEDFHRAKTKFSAKRIYYIPGIGVDVEKYAQNTIDKREKRAELEIPQDATVLLSVGELNRNKNHEVILRAMAKLKNPNIFYCIAGAGPLENYLLNLVKELKVEKNFQLLGYRRDINELCQMADIFCFPSMREGLSVALMEAMATSKPVICSQIRGNCDLIEENLGGLLFNPKNQPAVNSVVKQIIEAKYSWQSFGSFNKEKVANFSISSVNEKIQNIYNEVNNAK